MEIPEKWLLRTAVEKKFTTLQKARQAALLWQKYRQKGQNISLIKLLIAHNVLSAEQIQLLERLFHSSVDNLSRGTQAKQQPNNSRETSARQESEGQTGTDGPFSMPTAKESGDFAPSIASPDIGDSFDLPSKTGGETANIESPDIGDSFDLPTAKETIRSEETNIDTGDTNNPQQGQKQIFFGRYQVIRQLGQGNFGKVFLVYDPEWNRQLALKVLSSAMVTDDVAVKRFQREAQAIAQLRHDNIIGIYEVGKNDGQHFFTMDYIDGESLAEFIKREGRMTPRRASEVMAKIARAVHYAHEKNIVHRDIKPANAMIDSQERPFLADFGLAKAIRGGSRLSQTGNVIGSPAYMSPEQAHGENREVDERSDIYSLGATLYELICGELPFPGDNPMHVLYRVTYEPPTSPRQLNKDIAQDLENICLKCLEKEKKDRYSSALKLAEDLERFLNGIGVEAVAPRISWKRWLRTHKTLAATIFSLVMVLVALWSWREIVKHNEINAVITTTDAFFADNMQETEQLKTKKRKAFYAEIDTEELAKRRDLLAKYRDQEREIEKTLAWNPQHQGLNQRLFDIRRESGYLALGGRNYLMSRIYFDSCAYLVEKFRIKTEEQNFSTLVDDYIKNEKESQLRRIDEIIEIVDNSLSEEVLTEYAIEIGRMKGEHTTKKLFGYIQNRDEINKPRRLVAIEAFGYLLDNYTQLGAANKTIPEYLMEMLEKLPVKKNLREAKVLIYALGRYREERASELVWRIRWKAGQDTLLWWKTRFFYAAIPISEKNLKTPAEWNRLGVFYIYRYELHTYDPKDLQMAIKAFREALRVSPKNASIFNNHGIACAKQGNMDQAKKDFIEAVKLGSLAAGNHNLGNIYYERGDYAKALEYFRKVPEAEKLTMTYAGESICFEKKEGFQDFDQKDIVKFLLREGKDLLTSNPEQNPDMFAGRKMYEKSPGLLREYLIASGSVEEQVLSRKKSNKLFVSPFETVAKYTNPFYYAKVTDNDD